MAKKSKSYAFHVGQAEAVLSPQEAFDLLKSRFTNVAQTEGSEKLSVGTREKIIEQYPEILEHIDKKELSPSNEVQESAKLALRALSQKGKYKEFTSESIITLNEDVLMNLIDAHLNPETSPAKDSIDAALSQNGDVLTSVEVFHLATQLSDGEITEDYVNHFDKSRISGQAIKPDNATIVPEGSDFVSQKIKDVYEHKADLQGNLGRFDYGVSELDAALHGVGDARDLNDNDLPIEPMTRREAMGWAKGKIFVYGPDATLEGQPKGRVELHTNVTNIIAKYMDKETIEKVEAALGSDQEKWESSPKLAQNNLKQPEAEVMLTDADLLGLDAPSVGMEQ